MKEFPTHTATCITMHDVCEIMGVNMHKFEFMQMVPNDSYQILFLDDEHIFELTEDIAWERNKFNERRVERLENELELVQHLRAQGLTNSVLVWVSW